MTESVFYVKNLNNFFKSFFVFMEQNTRLYRSLRRKDLTEAAGMDVEGMVTRIHREFEKKRVTTRLAECLPEIG